MNSVLPTKRFRLKKNFWLLFWRFSFFVSLTPFLTSCFATSSNFDYQNTVTSQEVLEQKRQEFKLDSSWNILSTAYVIDGDTFSFQKDVYENRLRLIGVDTPEPTLCIRKGNECDFVPTTGLQYHFAKLASDFVRSLFQKAKFIFWKRVTLDRYNRQISRVNVDGQDLSVLLVKNRYATVRYIDKEPNSKYYYQDFEFIDTLHAAQLQAKSSGVGIWTKNGSLLEEIFPKKRR